MKQDNFEQEIDKLYRQRKQSIEVPKVELSSAKQRKNSSIIKYTSIFMMGGFASFSIMALVNYLAQSPEAPPKPAQVPAKYQIEIEKAQQEKSAEIVKQKLPQKPERNIPDVPDRAVIDKPEQLSELTTIDVEKISVDENVTVPKVKQVEQIPKLVVKKLPEYRFSTYEKQSGFVRLSYKINKSGEPEDIQIVDTNLGKGIQKASKKALRQWQYQSGVYSESSFEIIFEFNNAK